jgi:hypothetical protein
VLAAGVGLTVLAFTGRPGAAGGAPAGSRWQVPTLRERLLARAPIPFEAFAVSDTADNADDIIARGWDKQPYGRASLTPPIRWKLLCMSNRSWNHGLHAWEWMSPVLHAFEVTGDRTYLDWAIARAVSWGRVFNDGNPRGTMAWYDMTTGMRAYRLAYLVEQAILRDAPATALNVLLACVARHQKKLLAPSIFVRNNNHGFYVAAGQSAFARRLAPVPGMSTVARSGRQRLAYMARQQFSSDGGHREHSAGYHRMVLGSFLGVRDAGLLTDAGVLRRLARAEEVLGWLVQPNGELVQVGDTSAEPVRSRHAESADPHTLFILTGGERGTPNDERLKVLPKTGYAVVRDPQPCDTTDHLRSSYLFLSAAFHSRAHKQADNLTIVWFDREQEILIDAGKFGYVHHQLPATSRLYRQGFYYDAPQRMFVESTRAHNTVAVDNADHPRVGRRPYGSGVASASQRDGHYRIVAAVSHGAWRHRRELLFLPGSWLQVTDTVVALDRRRHDVRVWWHFPQALRPVPYGSGRLSIEVPGLADRLWVAELGRARAIAPRAGRNGPLEGWRSREDLRLTPAWATGFEAEGVRSHTFRTLFHFGSEPRTSPFPHPWA